jgi:hypothetical protein
MSGSEATVLGLNPVNQVKNHSNEIEFKFKTRLNFLWSKQELPEVENFEINYGCEWFKERNNFLHKNFFSFEIDFELKIWEIKVCFWL